MLTVAGVSLPFLDVIETVVGFEYEGNPFLTTGIILPQVAWIVFVFLHLALSASVIFLGGKASLEAEVGARATLEGLVLFMAIVTGMNAILLKLYGAF
jgi:hypothetical protein